MSEGGARRVIAPVRPGPGARLLINTAFAVLWTSGGVWLICRYFLRVDGEWGPEPHPAEPWLMRVHGVGAFLALWTVGLLWGRHVVGAWATRRNRTTGVLLVAWLGLMALTGYLLVWGTDDGIFGVVSPTHWVAGLGLPAAYLLHRFLRPGNAA